MKEFIKKNWALIGFIVAIIFDSQYGILEKLITDPFWLNIARGLGAVILGYFTENKLGLFSKDTDTSIGGGGIKNPPKP